MTTYRLVADPRADLDIAATFEWYERELAGLGQEFLVELRVTYDRAGASMSITGMQPTASGRGRYRALSTLQKCEVIL